MKVDLFSTFLLFSFVKIFFSLNPRPGYVLTANFQLPLALGVMFFFYEGWNFNSGNYLFTTDTK